MKKVQLSSLLLLRIKKAKMKSKMQKAFAVSTVMLVFLFQAYSVMIRTN